MRANHLFVFFTSGQQLWRFNDGIQAIEIEHAVLPRRRGLVLVQTGVIALQGGEVVLVVDGFFHDLILENVRSPCNRL